MNNLKFDTTVHTGVILSLYPSNDALMRELFHKSQVRTSN